jgi:hypothetical protein
MSRIQAKKVLAADFCVTNPAGKELNAISVPRGIQGFAYERRFQSKAIGV